MRMVLRKPMLVPVFQLWCCLCLLEGSVRLVATASRLGSLSNQQQSNHHGPSQEKKLSPVILIPGDGGSALEIKIHNKPHGIKHWWCKTSTHNQWERLWLQPTELLPKQVDCWSDNIRLRYNATSDTVMDAKGTEIRVIPGIKGLHLIPSSNSNVYSNLIHALQKQAREYLVNTTNFNKNVSVKNEEYYVQAATYDFRYSPIGKPSTIDSLKAMVETTFEKTQTPITLITHSLGGLLGHYFLTRSVSQEWKRKYIANWIPIAPALGGAVVLLVEFISGDNEGIKWLSGKSVRDEQRSYENNAWLLPNPNLFGSDEVLVVTPKRNYTSQQYEDLFLDIQYTNGKALWRRVKNLTMWDEHKNRLVDPMVPVYPIYGTNVSTIVQYQYKDVDFYNYKDPSSTVKALEGDGTIPLKSLEAGNSWDDAHAPLVVSKASHTDILSDESVISRILDIVQTAEAKSTTTSS